VGDTSAKTLSEREGREKRHREKEGDEEEGGENKEEGGIEEQKEGGGEKEEGGEEKKNEGGEKKEGWKEKTDEREEEKEEEGGKNKEEGGIEEKNERWKETKEGGGEMKEERGEMKEEGGEKKDEREEEKRNGDEEEEMEEKEEETKEEEGEKKKEGGEKKKEEDNVKKKKKEGEEELLKENVAPVSLALPGQQVCTDSFNHKVNDISSTSSTSSSFSSSSPLPVFLPRHIIMDKDDRQKSSMPLLLLLPHDTKSPSSSLSQEKTREKNSTSSFSRLLEREEEIETPLSTLSSISESRGEKRGEEEEKKKKVQEKEHTVSLVYKMKESLSTQQEEKIKSSPSPGETLESSLGTSSSVKETEMGEEKEDEKKEEEETKEEEEEEKKEEEGEKKEEEIDKDTPLMTAEDTSKSSRCDTSVFPSSSTPLSPSSSSSPLSNRRTATASSSSSSPPSGVLPSSLVRHTSSCPPNRRNYREEKGSRRAEEEEEEKKGREDGEERKEERSNDLKEKLARSNTRCTRGLGVNSPLSPSSSSSSLPSMSYQEKRRRTPSSSSSLLSSPSTPSLKRRPTTREKNRSKGLSVSLSPSCRKLCKGRTSPSPLNTKLMRKTQGLSPSSSSSLQTMKPSSTSQNSRCKKDGRSAQILRRREQEKRKDRGSLHIHGNLCNGVESASASSPSSSSSSSSSLSEEKRIESKESSNFLKKIEVFETPWLRVRLTNIPLKHQWKAHLNYEDKVEFLIKNGIAQTTCFRREAPSSLTICKQYDWKNHQAMFEDEDRTTFYRNALCWRGWKKYEAKRKEQQKRRLHAEGCRKTEEETGVSLSMTNRFEDLLSQPKKIDLLSSPAEAHLQQKGVGKRDEGEGGKRREEEERQGRQMMGTVEDRDDREETSERKEESSRRGEKREDSHSKKKRRSSPFLSMRSKRRRVKPQGMTTECPTERREREGRSSQRRLPEHRSLEHRFVEDFPTEEERFSSRSLIWGFSCRSLTDENACSSSLTGKDQESEDTAASDKEKDSQRNVKSFIVERPHELEEEKEGNVDEGNTEKDPTSHPAPSPYSSSSSSSSPSSLHSPSSSFAPSSCSSSSSSSLSPCPSSSSSFPSSSSLHSSSSSSPSSSSSSSSSSSRAFASLGDGDEGERVAKERDEVFSSSTPISNALSLGRNVLHSPLQSLDKPQREASSLPLPLDQLAPTTSMHIDSSSSSVSSSSSSFSSTSLSDPLLSSSSSSLLVSSSPLHNDVKTEISLLSHTKGPCLSSLPCMHALGCHSLDRQTDESLFQHRVETSPSSLKEQRKYIESTDEEVETSTSDEDEEEENRRRALPLSGDEEDEEEFVDDGAIDHISRSSSRKSRGPFKTDSQLKKEKNLKKKKNKKEEKRKKKRKTFVEGKRILEIGTGPIALLAILALKAGAEYVDALEVSRSSASLATAFVRQFGINSAYSRYQKKNRGSSFLSSSSSSSCSSSSSPSTSSSSEDESEDENIKTGGSFCKKEEKESFLLNTANLFGSNSLTPTNPIHTDISSSPSSFEICTAPAAGSLPSNVSRGSSSVHRKEEHTACTDVKAQESQGDACKRTPQLSSSSSSPSRSSSSLVLLKKRKRGESVKKKKRERHLSSSSSSSSLSSSSTSSRLCIHHCYSKLFPLPPPHLEPKFYRQHTFPHFFKSSSPLSSSLLPSPSPLPPSSSPSPLPLSSSPSPLPASSPPFPP
ncbi:hypothetical protein CSUI_000608, partial [Cystoisospora suis]